MVKKSLALSFLALMPLVSESAKFDPPDLNLELQMHRSFQIGRRQGGVLSGWTARNEHYRLQRGETLWTLSEMLYGDGQYWPRIWAQNQAIANPHLVKPGHTLQFLLGSEDDMPAFRFSEDEPEASLELVASTTSNPIVEIPPPEMPPKPVINIPRSFPEWQQMSRRPPPISLDDSRLGRQQEKLPDRIWLRSWVQEAAVVPVGYFLENDSEAGLPVVNQYVYVKLKKGQGRPGQKLLVVNSEDQIQRMNNQWDGKDPAFLVQVYAELELTEPMKANFERKRDQEEFEAYRALVTRTTGLSFSKSALIPGALETVNLDRNGRYGTTEAQLIGSEKHASSTMFGPGDIVFLNRGAKDGVVAGQLFDIYINRTARHPNTPVTFSPASSGLVKVVKVSDRLSTAILLEAREGIQQGDAVRHASAAGDLAEELDVKPTSSPRDSSDDELESEDDGLSEELDDELDEAF